MEAQQPQNLQPAKCEQCRKQLEADRFALFYDHKRCKRSCEHIVCGSCRGIMNCWKKMECPNSKCGKRFYSIHEALSPGTASTEDFFKFVNLSATGRISKEELVVYYTTNTSISREEAVNMIDANWKF